MVQMIHDLASFLPTGPVGMSKAAAEKSRCLGVLFFFRGGARSYLPGKWWPVVFCEKRFLLNSINNAGYLITWALRVAASASGGPVAARAWRCRLACGPASGLLAAQPPPLSASARAAAAPGLGAGARGEAWHFGRNVKKTMEIEKANFLEPGAILGSSGREADF